jgi:hypothetical protein
MTLREELRPMMFKSGVPKNKCGLKRDEGTG